MSYLIIEGTRIYLGDGVYAFSDGYHIWLHANDLDYPTDRVALEPTVCDAFILYIQRMRDTKKVLS